MAHSVTSPRVLVAGIGNVFLGDDGFGVEVARRFAGVAVPDGVAVVDFGIRGVHLALELLNGYDALVIIDTMELGEPPGTVVIFEPDREVIDGARDEAAPTMEAHSMNPAAVLGMLGAMGGDVARVLVVGCEPAVIGETMGLSAPMTAAVEVAVAAVGDVLAQLCPVVSQTT